MLAGPLQIGSGGIVIITMYHLRYLNLWVESTKDWEPPKKRMPKRHVCFVRRVGYWRWKYGKQTAALRAEPLSFLKPLNNSCGLKSNLEVDHFAIVLQWHTQECT